ncbi:MAG: hypothetical protein LBB23_02110 [Rickettsiales bacterium]|jgi:dihydroorotase|nr:hypothetical protein [Rickettsiales bacterium]
MKLINAHLHAREDHTAEFREVMPIYTTDSAGIYMMNFPKPLELDDVKAAVHYCAKYENAILNAARAAGNPKHLPLLMIVLNETMTPSQLGKFIERARADGLGLAGFKLFSKGQSTNAGYAPTLEQAKGLIDVLETEEVPLALHMEDPDEPNASLKEEAAISKTLKQIVHDGHRVRKLKVSLEHISTRAAIQAVTKYNLNYTINPAHMWLCQEDFEITDLSAAEETLSKKYPFFFCKPILQTMRNRDLLWDIFAADQSGRLMPGTDSAPHDRAKKTGDKPMAGIFMGGTFDAYMKSATWEGAAPWLAKRLEKLSKNAAEFYNMNWDDLVDAKNPNYEALDRVVDVRTLSIKTQRGGR